MLCCICVRAWVHACARVCVHECVCVGVMLSWCDLCVCVYLCVCVRVRACMCVAFSTWDLWGFGSAMTTGLVLIGFCESVSVDPGDCFCSILIIYF